MTTDELVEHIAVTAADLSLKIREAILAGKSSEADDWASALESTCEAYNSVVVCADDDD